MTPRIDVGASEKGVKLFRFVERKRPDHGGPAFVLEPFAY
jgi:hypothetical protein